MDPAELLSAKAQWAVEQIDLPEAAQIEGARWEDFQLAFLNNTARFGMDVKSRQIAWSFTAAVDAAVDSVLVPGTPHIMVSINLDEAKEKIRYARNVIGAISDPRHRPRLARDSQTELELANGSRIISHPCRPVRGLARARVYLDEMAHYPHGLDREVYRAALPATTKGDGYIRLGSSPLGARGLFWEIATETMRRYPGYRGRRRFVPWWHVRYFCTDRTRAKAEAPGMPTEERVRAFGTEAIRDIFDNMVLEDFQQEYEASFVDESTAWISWDIIQKNQLAFTQNDLTYFQAHTVTEALDIVPQIVQAIRDGRCEPVLAGGLDVGRKRDATALCLVGKGAGSQLPGRVWVELVNVPYDDQEKVLHLFLDKLPITRLLIDATGIGNMLAERLSVTGRVEGVQFTNPLKELWSVEARVQAERGNTPLPPIRDLAYQIHAIKRVIGPSARPIFDAERNSKNHSDLYWAWALALTAAKAAVLVLDERHLPETMTSPWHFGLHDPDLEEF